ncbi:uncharacterized protein G2W53_009623 [Senna tora]|uniref:Retrotransposon gag domain-containing protein n=1 Tax=Senna tora TaxID=362788 RepID=A0A835C8H8_9FABA|nr:uncharacterized protein G2W53_009623 [Senna tora]
MAEQNNRNVSDYASPKLDGLQHSIRRPSIQANNFEIKPATIQLLQANGQFGGSPIEDPNNHILNFLEICDTFKHNGVSDDAIRLRLFPFSLRDKAKVWLQSLLEGSITTWEELAQQFLTKYFPPGKTAKMRNDITSFVLLDNESLYEAWERFKELLKKCPHHGLPKWLQVQTFYNGLSSEIRTSIDAAAGGALMSKPVDAAYTLLETMSSNNHQWHSDRHVHARVTGVQESDMFASLSSQIVVLTKEVKSLGIQGAVKAMSPFMVDRSIAYPRGIIENVLVKVDKLILPADFIVLDYEEDKNVPIILGRPFLATGRTIIDVQKGELTMRVQDQEILEAPPWKIRAPPWCHKPSPSYSREQDWTFMQGLQDKIGKCDCQARTKCTKGETTRIQRNTMEHKRRIRMAYLEEQTQHLTACNGVIHQNFREFVKCTNSDKMDPHYQDLPPPPEH